MRITWGQSRVLFTMDTDPLLNSLSPQDRQIALLTNLRLQRCLEVRELIERELEARQNSPAVSCKKIVDYVVLHSDSLLSQSNVFIDMPGPQESKAGDGRGKETKCIVS